MKHAKNKLVELPDLEDFGEYRLGLTSKEVEDYLRNSYNKVAGKKRKDCPAKIIKQFYEIAGTNTGALGPSGEHLMYRHDVDRFAKQLFFGTPTYLD